MIVCPSSFARRALVAWACVGFMAAAAAQVFTPNERLVSPQRDLVDAEYSATRSQFVWADSTGKLWIGGLDPVTGEFKPRNGKGVLVDADALTTADLAITFNGPEWVSTSTGDKIVYTKFVAGQPHTTANARLALAEPRADGTWGVRTLGPNASRIGPYASQDPADPQPRITYIDRQSRHYWRYLSSAASEEAIPGLPPSTKSVRFVGGRQAVVFSTPAAAGVSQVFTYDLQARLLQQVTYDDGQKDLQTVPWVWQAPELGHDLVLMTVVDESRLRLYRGRDVAGTLNWAVHHEVPMPPGTRIASPEPFVFNGRSYVLLTLNVGGNNYPSAVYVAGIDPARPLLRKVSDDSLPRARIDPEAVVVANGVYIYYNRFNPAVNPQQPFCADCSEGVFRAFTGLTAP